MGRAHAGLGDSQEATSSMQACIEAVKTAPAYKYRTEKRWLHEAQAAASFSALTPVEQRRLALAVQASPE